ncbi:MAG: ATP-binding cassette domain-containing protein [Deltaproteobacteria bacterium]
MDGADAGVVEVLGRDLAAMNDNDRTLARRRAIGIIYQFFNLVPNLDVHENVVLPYLIDGEAPDQAAVQTALERVGMRHRAKHLPSQLSGGEMQLVSIARAIARAPRLILADEPTGNVNVATGKRIMTLMSEVLKETGSAMLLVTHNPDDAARADRVVFLTDGAIDASTSLVGDEVSVSAIHTQLEKLGI